MNGFFDIVYLGDGFKGNQSAQFFKDVDNAKAAIMRCAPFSSRSDIRFNSFLSKKSLGCDDSLTGSTGAETIGCNPQRIIAAIKDLPCNLVIVIANGKGHAGFDGDRIISMGVGDHSSNPIFGCTFLQAAWDGKQMHEIGHYFLGMNHDNTTFNKMNDGVNGGCAIWAAPFTQAQQEIITTKLNKIVTA